MGESREVDEERAFAHLQELVDELPRMQELGEKARRAHVAAEVAGVEHELEVARATFARSEAELAEVRARLTQTQEAGDEVQVDHFRREVLFHADQLALAKGPVNDAEFRLSKLLMRENLADARSARAYALAPVALADLDERIAAYQRDYQQTYALCQEFAGSQD